MTLVAGCPPEEHNTASLYLAAMLARSSGDDVVVCSVVPKSWYPSMAKVDAEYMAALCKQADAALEHAKATMPSGVRATYIRHAARSAPSGLVEVAEEHGAELIVVGSSTAGAFGHIVLGTASDRLLHSSPVPVAMAPRGFRTKQDANIRRVTAAYG